MKVSGNLSGKLRSIYSSFPPIVRRGLSSGLRKFGIYSKVSPRSTETKRPCRVKISGNNSFMMILYGSSIENEISRNGLFKSWESDVGWIWISLCKISDVIIDIGANRGVYSLVAKSLNSQAQVIAFEPSIHHFGKLTENVKLNNYDITCEQLAISNRSSSQIFYDLPNPNRNTASLSADKMKNFKGYTGSILEYEVKTETLHNYIKNNSIPKVDLIKMDIEMYEPEALEGLGIYLELYKPVVILEVLTQKIAARLNKLIYWKDYQLFHLRKDASAQRMKKFEVTVDFVARGEWNFILFHKELENKMRKSTMIYRNNKN